jgi:hypothetical protein
MLRRAGARTVAAMRVFGFETPRGSPVAGRFGVATPGAFWVATPGALGVATPVAFGVATPVAFGVATPGTFGAATPGALGVATPGALGVATPGAMVRAALLALLLTASIAPCRVTAQPLSTCAACVAGCEADREGCVAECRARLFSIDPRRSECIVSCSKLEIQCIRNAQSACRLGDFCR